MTTTTTSTLPPPSAEALAFLARIMASGFITPPPTSEVSHEVRSAEVLADFTRFCYANPNLRFWQALAVWLQGCSIYITEDGWLFPPSRLEELNLLDPFSWEGKDG